jgi:hypothetical protein
MVSPPQEVDEATRGKAVVICARGGSLEGVEVLLDSGLISSQAAKAAMEEAKGTDKGRIIELVGQSKTVDLEKDQSFAMPKKEQFVEPVVFELTFAEVEKNPRLYLDMVKEKGFPSYVKPKDAKVVDLGAATKQFVTALAAGIEKGYLLRKSNTGFPAVGTESEKEVIRQLGFLFSCISHENKMRKYRCNTGFLLSPKFFDLVQKVSLGQTKEEVLQWFVEEIAIKDPGLELEAVLVQDPENDELQEKYAAAFYGDKKDAADDAREQLYHSRYENSCMSPLS